MSGSVSPIEHHTGPSQNTRAQKRKLEEILDEVPNNEFDDQLLCFELTTSLNSDEDIVKVMGTDVPLAVQSQAFPKLAGLFKMQRKAMQDKKDWEEALNIKVMREREYELERVRNHLIILNRFYLAGGIVAAHPARVFYSQHDPHRYHPISAATRQYSPRSPVEPVASGSNIRINHARYDSVHDDDDPNEEGYKQYSVPSPSPSPPPDRKGKGVAGRSKRQKFNKYRFQDIQLGYKFPNKNFLSITTLISNQINRSHNSGLHLPIQKDPNN